jgi:hypothetical protein
MRNEAFVITGVDERESEEEFVVLRLLHRIFLDRSVAITNHRARAAMRSAT